jgi:Cu/Ag efflux protein CusF
MLRTIPAALLIAFCIGGVASAADYTGKVTAFDTATRKVTIHVDDKDESYALAKDCKIYKLKGAGKRAQYVEDPKGLKHIIAGAAVSVSTDIVDGDEVVTILKIESPTRKNP